MERVVVLEPSPLLTVTVEAARDGDEVHLHAGGQGSWVSHMLSELEVPVTLVAAIGGETGRVLAGLLAGMTAELVAVPVEASNACYVDDRRSGQRQRLAETPPPVLSRHDVDDLGSAVRARGLVDGSLCVLAGPATGEDLPADAYRALAADLTKAGTRVVADLSGPPLQAAVAGGAFLVKVSHEQLRADGLAADADEASLLGVMQELHADGAANVVVTHAQEPTLALLEGELLRVKAPTMQVVEFAGAGDSLTAGIVAGLARGQDLRDALRLGTAAGALNVARRGLGSGRKQDIERLAEAVTVEPVRRRHHEPIETVSPAELSSWVRS